MRIHQVDLERILPGLSAWEALPREARLAWVLADGHKNTRRDAYGADEQALLAAGLLEATPTGLRRIPKGARPLHLVLRAAEACTVLQATIYPEEHARSYMQATYTQAERVALLAEARQGGPEAAGRLASRVLSRVWVQDLLNARPATWEKPRLTGPQGGSMGWERLLTPALHAELVRLVARIVEAGGPIRLSSLFEGLSGGQVRRRATTLQAALRYLVLFPQVDPESVELEVGLAPDVARGLARGREPVPEVVQVEVVPTPAFWISDMVTVLLDAAGGQARVKATGGELYQKTAERLLSALSPLPPLVEAWTDAGSRLNWALWGLQELSLVHVEVQPNGRRLLRPTPISQDWLAAPAVERLRTVADLIRGDAEKDEFEILLSQYRRAQLLAPGVQAHQFVFEDAGDDELADAIRAALGDLPTEGAIQLAAWLRRQSLELNPLTGTGTGGHSFKARHVYFHEASPEEREEAWFDVLVSAITVRLVPLGGVAVGGEVDTPFVALTPVGRYLIRASDELALPDDAKPTARILVQPNFDVVFMGPAPEHEALLTPFAERVGHDVGTLFHLTRDAAARAAAAGLTADEALERLTRAQDGPLPENVSRSVRGWFSRVRRVEAAEALILKCPDTETADRVAVVGGPQTHRLGPLIVEIEGTKALGRIEKKLVKEGIFVLRAPPTEDRRPVPRRPRKRRRRRW